jgi:hypothetical protein
MPCGPSSDDLRCGLCRLLANVHAEADARLQGSTDEGWRGPRRALRGASSMQRSRPSLAVDASVRLLPGPASPTLQRRPGRRQSAGKDPFQTTAVALWICWYTEVHLCLRPRTSCRRLRWRLGPASSTTPTWMLMAGPEPGSCDVPHLTDDEVDDHVAFMAPRPTASDRYRASARLTMSRALEPRAHWVGIPYVPVTDRQHVRNGCTFY